MNPNQSKKTVGHRLIVNYRGASRNAASVILTVWLVGIASWFVNASAVYTSALAIEPGITREISITVTRLIKTASESVGVGSVENVIDRLRDRNRDGISLVQETIAQSEHSDPQINTGEIEQGNPIRQTTRAGDGIVLNSIPILELADYKPRDVGRTVRVLVTGDSLSTFAGQELIKLLAGNQNFVVRVEWANGSGLTKPNVLDWGQYARDLTDKYQPDLVIVILGGSDTVSMVNAGELIDRKDVAWEVEYARRVDLVVNEFAANKVTNVVWAGPPPVADKNRNLSYQKINSSLQSVSLTNSTIKYLDTFTNLEPKLSAEINGSDLPLRQPDGVHWTRDASKLIAAELAQMLLELRP